MSTTTDDVYAAAARSLSRLWEAADHESQPAARPLGRRTVRAHRDPSVLHIAGTDRYSTTPGVTVVVDYTPGEGKAAMDALMSAVGEVRKQIEEERKADSERPSTDDLLGADPEWTGGLSVDEYMNRARRRQIEEER